VKRLDFSELYGREKPIARMGLNDESTWQKAVEITKMDPDKHLVFGWANIAFDINSSLDSKRSKDVMRLIRNLTKTLNIATLMVTHDEEMLTFADQIVKMSDGVILQKA
jgi:ABC-type arginine transport system ATPase subunit